MTRVTDDLFGIAGRLREIDPRYDVFWDGADYKIFLSDLLILTACFLDERVLCAVREELDFDAVMEHNANIEKSAERAMDIAVRQLGEMFEFAAQTSHEVTFTKGGKIW